ncbi:MAG: EamA family transporter, partial [Deferrisomatales bacterium]
SALGYLLWNAAIPALGVTATNNLIYGIPLVGVLAGVAFLGEPLTARVALGGALIVGGVAVASRARPGPGLGSTGQPAEAPQAFVPEDDQ